MVRLSVSEQSAIKYHLNQARTRTFLDLALLDYDYLAADLARIIADLQNCDTALSLYRTPVLVQVRDETITQNNQTTTTVVRPGSTTTTVANYGNRTKQNYQRLNTSTLYSQYIKQVEHLAKTLGIEL